MFSVRISEVSPFVEGELKVIVTEGDCNNHFYTHTHTPSHQRTLTGKGDTTAPKKSPAAILSRILLKAMSSVGVLDESEGS